MASAGSLHNLQLGLLVGSNLRFFAEKRVPRTTSARAYTADETAVSNDDETILLASVRYVDSLQEDCYVV